MHLPIFLIRAQVLPKTQAITVPCAKVALSDVLRPADIQWRRAVPAIGAAAAAAVANVVLFPPKT
jgi:hypothetical protein